MSQASEAIAGMGHNQPPSLFERLAEDHAQLRHSLECLASRATAAPREIKSQDDLRVIGTLIIDARDLAKKATLARVAEKEPFLTAGREVDTFFKTITDRLDRISQFFQKLADDHQRAVAAEARRKAEEEARAAREEEAHRLALAAKAEDANREKHAEQHTAKAEAAGFAADRAEATANASAAALTRQRFDSGVLATSKEAWAFEVIDFDAIPLDKLRPYFTRAHIEQAIRMAVKMGHRELAGVRIFEDIKASFR
jgi:hypothetical protein